jgi:hypothetical protein
MHKKYHFLSVQKHQSGGQKTVRKVQIKNGKGHKSISYYSNGKLVKTAKKGLNNMEMEMIKVGKFIPGLFKDCNCNKKTRKARK